MSEQLEQRLESRFPKGTLVDAQVQRILRHGTEVVLRDGTPGIVRKRELVWDDDASAPAEILQPDQKIKLLVIGWDHDRGRLELSLRQVERDPWAKLSQRYQPGDIVRRPIARLWRTGAFVEIEPSVDGFIPVQEISFQPPERVDQILWVGDMIEAVITRLDDQARHIELSIKEHLRNLQILRAASSSHRTASEASATLSDALHPADRQKLVEWISHRPADESNSAAEHSELVQTFPKILIAEDDVGFRNSLTRLLKRLGHQVDAVNSAEKAIEQALPGAYSLVLMDMGFENSPLNGLEAGKQILAKDPLIPIVLLSGLDWLKSYSTQLALARQIGVRGALVKPIALHRLRQVMQYIAQGKDAWELEHTIGSPDWELVNRHVDAGSRDESLTPMLERQLADLQRATGASACVLFHMEPVTRETQVLAHAGVSLRYDELTKHTLQATPIDAVIRQNRRVYAPDASQNPARFKHLKLLDFSSCLGVPIALFEKTEHALFLFHPERNHFVRAHLDLVQTAATQIGLLMAQAQAVRVVQQVQPYVFIGQLGSTLMHELNNRLGSVMNDAETLAQDYARIIAEPGAALDPHWRDEVGACISQIKEKGKDISAIAQLYLGLVGAEALEPVNVNDIIHKAQRLLQHVAASNHVAITTTLANDLPLTLSISKQLEQAFLNVMLNAIQQIFLAKGRGELDIQTVFEDSALPIKIRFTDTGPGVHTQLQERIFDLGFSTRRDGSGIGLFITRNLIESLGGKIWIEHSTILLGTTFLIGLPMVLPSTEEKRRGR